MSHVKYLGTSDKYSYVCKYENRKTGEITWQGKIGNNGKHCKTEREAALNVDKQLIAQGREPKNILKRQ